MMADKSELPNIKALSGFRGPKGEHVAAGTVMAKSAFDSKGDWHTLCHMTPPRAIETDDKVGVPKAAAIPAV